MSNTIGSGLDVNSIVEGLMSIQQKDLLQLDQNKALLKTQQASYKKLREMLDNFTNNCKSLRDILNKSFFKAQSSNDSIVSAVINGQQSAAGTYSIQVTQLAKAQQLASASFTSADQSLTVQGNLDVTVGSNHFTLSIDPADSLDTIRDHINNSSNNQSVSASILKTSTISGQDEYRLLLTSKNTGAVNQIQLGGSGLASLDLTQQIQSAQDAKFSINNFNVVRSSNLVSDVLDGVTFQLNQESGSALITIDADTENEQKLVKDSLQTMVNSYNAVVEFLSKNLSISTLKDNTCSIIKSNLKHAMAQTIGNSSVNSLLSMGIKLADAQVKTNEEGIEYVVEGKLSLDDKLLDSTLQNNFSNLRTFLSGVGVNFTDSMDDVVSGIETQNIFSKERIIGQQNAYLDQRIGREEARLETMKMNLTVKYAALDAYLSRYRQMGDFLDMQISMMSGSSAKR